MIKFKSIQVSREFDEAPIFLKIIAKDFALASIDKAIEPVITRVMEPVDGSSGVHEAGRAVDFRNEFNGKTLYSPSQVAELIAYINAKYYRNDDKPTMIHHSFNGGPFHFHIQISADNMVYRKKA